MPTFFKASLEPSLFVSIVETFLHALNNPDDGASASDRPGLVREYLVSFGRVPRFSTLLLFLSDEEQKLAQSLCNVVGGVEWDW